MTTSYPPRAPKRLERSRSDKFLFGVCGGVARYLNVDPTLVRVLTVALTLFTGVPLIVYLVAAFVMPEEDTGLVPPDYPPVHPHAATWTPPPAASGFGTAPTAPDPVWGTSGAPWEQRPTEPADPLDPQPAAPTDPEAPVAPPPPKS